MKKVLLVAMLFMIFSAIFNVQASYCKNTVLEFEDVNFFSVQSIDGSTDQIMISGLAMTSMLAVGSVTMSFHENSLSLYITMVKPEKWLRGDFSVSIIIPDNADKIYFGRKEKLIWERNQK